MQIRDRIQELRRVRAAALKPNPRNWRTHPPAQQNALRGMLAEIGYADALLARELADGSLELIDGHLRAETTPDSEVPVLIVDLDDAEAAKLMLFHDPLAAMAETNEEALAELAATIETESEALESLLAEMIQSAEQSPLKFDAPDQNEPPEIKIPELYQLVVECRDEAHQQELFERLTAEGFKCRTLIL